MPKLKVLLEVFPGGEDFFSPCLMEADLMRRILPSREYKKWLSDFLPDLLKSSLNFKPAVVTDRSDPKIVHLDGLNLSRAWCLAGIASAFSKEDQLHIRMKKLAFEHAEAAMASITSGNYEGEHWLATFAVTYLSAGEKLF